MIDTQTFEYEESRWGDIYKHLQKSGFEVYSPGMKVGECISPYVVVSVGPSSEHALCSSDVDLYYVMCYVPKQAYSTLEPLVFNVMESMKELEPLILPYGMRQPSYYDDMLKAHMVSITYKNYKKQ